MIPVKRALKIVNRETQKLGIELVGLADSVGRILAENIIADSDMPPFDRSQMDGFALFSKDTKTIPVELRIVGESAAGRGWKGMLKSGEAVRIMTGAPVPTGADAVQKLELAKEFGHFVEILESSAKGQHIVRRGSEIKKSGVVMRPGEVITPNSIAIPAAFGYAKIKVVKQPRVSILATGSEIVEINKIPNTDQIRDSNSLTLASLSQADGAKVNVSPIVGDDISGLKSQISAAIKNSDILITTGGVSVGKYDLIKPALHELGAEIFFEQVRLKPGKPTVFAKLKNTLIFGLPGNPVSAAVTYYLFVRKAILQLQTATKPDLKRGTAIVTRSVKAPKERDAYLPATLSTDVSGCIFAEPLNWHNSSDFIGFAQTEALIEIPRGKIFAQGECVKILFLA